MAREAWIAAIFFPLAGSRRVAGTGAVGAFRCDRRAVSLQQKDDPERSKGIPAWQRLTVPLMVDWLRRREWAVSRSDRAILRTSPLVALSAVIAIVRAALRAFVYGPIKGS
jgi:hypothetical protein